MTILAKIKDKTYNVKGILDISIQSFNHRLVHILYSKTHYIIVSDSDFQLLRVNSNDVFFLEKEKSIDIKYLSRTFNSSPIPHGVEHEAHDFKNLYVNIGEVKNVKSVIFSQSVAGVTNDKSNYKVVQFVIPTDNISIGIFDGSFVGEEMLDEVKKADSEDVVSNYYISIKP